MDRLRQIYSILTGTHASLLPDNHLLIRDNRTNNSYHIPLTPAGHSYLLPAHKLADIKDQEGKPLRVYDPSYRNTLQAASSICYMDGIRGLLEYRGYPIVELTDKSTFLETSFLLIYGELPSKDQLQLFSRSVISQSMMHCDLQRIIKSFRQDADPMGVLTSTLYALSTMTPQANPALQGEHIYQSPRLRNSQIFTILGILPTLVTRIYLHSMGKAPLEPHPTMGYIENFLYMLGSKLHQKTKLIKALQMLWILHAEEESSSSTAMVRHIASSGTDLYTAIATGTGVLSGVKYGGASAAVIHMLQSIGSRENIPVFMVEVREQRRLLFGFGHRIYRDNDPRNGIVREIVKEVFHILGKRPLVKLAIEVERIAQSDQYFITRNISPNIDFYTALIYHSMGIPSQLFPLLACIPRAAGWLAHWVEFQKDPSSILVRPSQNYVGPGMKQFVEQSERKEDDDDEVDTGVTQSRGRIRRQAAKEYKKLME